MKTIATGLLGTLMLTSMTVSVAMGAQSTTTRYSYNAAGNLTLAVDPLGRSTTFLVDNLNRHAQVRLPTPDNGMQNVIGMTYDGRDSVESVTDPRGLTTRYSVDGFGQRTTIGSPDTGKNVLASPCVRLLVG